MVNGTAAIAQTLQSGKVTSALASGTGLIHNISGGISNIFGIQQDIGAFLIFMLVGVGIKEFTGLSLFTVAIIVFALFALLKFGIIS